MVRALADLLVSTFADRVLRVAIDGPDAASKIILADETAGVVASLGRPVIRAGVDGFHNPQVIRRRRGSHSPDGYFLDAFDYTAARHLLIDNEHPDVPRVLRWAADAAGRTCPP